MNLTNRMKAVLVLPVLMFSSGQVVQAQCSQGGQLSTGRSQGRMQSFGRQSMMSAGMNLPQQNSLSTGIPALQSSLTSMMQQQQQVAMLAALQQLQQSRQLSALPQPQNSALVSHPGRSGSTDTVARRRRRSKSSADSDQLAQQRPVKDASTDEEIAARRLRMAKDLADDAQLALARGERRSAAKLRERAGERLLYIVENYSTTPSADEAKNLMQGLNP